MSSNRCPRAMSNVSICAASSPSSVRVLPDARSAARRAASGSGCPRSSAMCAKLAVSEPVALQALQRLADRRATHAERLRQRVVVDRLTGPDVQHDELVADGEIGPVRQGGRLRVELAGGDGHRSILGVVVPEVLPEEANQHTVLITLIYYCERR